MIGSQLQKGIVAALKVAPAVAGGRIYDRVPEGAAFPYLTLGDAQVLDDGNGCTEGWEVFSDVHVWSRPAAGSKIEAKDLAAEIVRRLVDGPVTLSDFTVLIAQLDAHRVMRDRDGVTEHAIITVRHVLQPA